MTLDLDSIQHAIKDKVMALAAELGSDASDLALDELIPASGFIDSAGLLDLIAWFEASYGIKIPDADLTIDNLGSARQMAEYLLRVKRGA